MTTARPMLGKVAIVTGGGFNVGRGVATAFAAAGAHVVVASRDEARLQATVAAITAEGGSARALRTDVTDLSQVEALVAFAERIFGAVDVMAAIAGGGCSHEPFDRMRPDAWDATFRTNVTSAFYCARAVMPTFRARNRGTLIVCTGGGSYYPVLDAPILAYACAKAAICRFVDQLTAELYATAIRVHGLDPGVVWSPEMLAKVAADERRTGAPHPDRARVRPPAAAGELAVWMASDASAPLRGRCISVYDAWWRDPSQVARVDADLAASRVWRHEVRGQR
jgi:NAD(P)-dependent dehydrogenase (short-subunit alcohol dehydrogenase family)